MTFEQIRILIESRLASWDDIPIDWDNVPNGPTLQAAIDAKEPWVRLTIQHGDSSIAALGSTPETRRTGLISCQVFTDERTGSATAYQIATSLTQRLEYWRQGQLETLSSSVRRAGPSDGWYQLNVTTPFRAG